MTTTITFLTREEEQELGRRVRAWLDDGGDEADGIAARNELMERNHPLVHWVIETRLAASPPAEGDDDVQEGVLGLARAAEKFDPTRGMRFVTYATYWITNFVIRSRRRRSLIRMPEYLYDVKRASSARQQQYRDNMPTRGNFDRETLDFVLYSAPAREMRGCERAAEDLLGECLEAANLTLRERRIVLGLSGLDGEPATLESLGVELGLTKERVRQLKERAWKKVWLGVHRHRRLFAEVDEYVRAV